jgi:amino acid transporter
MSTTGDRSGATVLPDTGRVDREEDARRLAELGYEPRFNREMSLAANFALGFTYLSPVVGVYALFAFALAEAGPPMIWSFFIAGAGQFLVALVFGEIVSQYPLAGGVYPWARRLWGRRYAWMTGWVYAWALLITVASVAYGAGAFAAILFEVEGGVNFTIGTALVIIAIATAVNLSGTKNLSRAATAGFVAEIVGAPGRRPLPDPVRARERPGRLLRLLRRGGRRRLPGRLPGRRPHRPLPVLRLRGVRRRGRGGPGPGPPDPAVHAADDPRRRRGGRPGRGRASSWRCRTSARSSPARTPIPIGSILTGRLRLVGSKIILAVVLISFFSCTLSLQAAASRLIFAYGRDRMIFGSDTLGRFSATRHVPVGALAVAAIVPALIVLGSRISEDALTKIISFAALGIYIGFFMVVLAALRARSRGWTPRGKFTLGRWGMPVTIAALAYQVAAMLNLVWPRTPDVPWYDNYIVLLSAAIVVAAGLAYMLIGRPYRHGIAAHGDAVSQRVAAEGAPLDRDPAAR